MSSKIHSYLVVANTMCMGKMQSGHKLMDIIAVQASFIDTLGNYFTDKVFASTSPSMQGEGERLFGVCIVQEANHSFHNHLLHEVLAKQFLVQILLER